MLPWHFGGPERLTVGEWKQIRAYFENESDTPQGDLPEGWESLPMED